MGLKFSYGCDRLSGKKRGGLGGLRLPKQIPKLIAFWIVHCLKLNTITCPKFHLAKAPPPKSTMLIYYNSAELSSRSFIRPLRGNLQVGEFWSDGAFSVTLWLRFAECVHG